MKKQIKKKLRLNKSTVSNLSPDEMSIAFGGKSLFIVTCSDPGSESCSLFIACDCTTTNPEMAAAPNPEDDIYLQ